VYIANTLKCRPPRNRNPEPEELARCEPFLVRQIELIRPRLILAMGRFAVHSLLRSSEPIGKLRGRVHRYQGVPLVVTYHPAYLLRNLADKSRAWDDLCLAAQTVEAASAPRD
jgi:DNA polymerase